MPIDPSIPLQARGITLQMPQEVQANALANLARQQQIQQGQQSMEDRNALRQLLSNASQGGTVDYGQLGKALLPYDSTAGFHMMQLGAQQNQQKQWQETQRNWAPPVSGAPPQAPGPPGAVSPGQAPPQVSGIFSGYRDNPDPGVVQMAKQGEQLLQMGAFKDPADVNAFVQRIGELDTRGGEGRAAAAARVQAAKDAAQARFEESQTRIAEARAGRAQEPKGVLVQTDQGPVFADPRTGQSVPVTDSATGKVAGAKPANIPQFVVEGVTKNQQGINTIDKALASLETPTGKSAVGPIIGRMPQFISNWQDPEGVATRADIADIGSMQIKNRSGATVTAAEEPRLLPFIPLPSDQPDAVKKKLSRLRDMLQGETDALTEFYPAARIPLKSYTDKTAAAPTAPTNAAPPRTPAPSDPLTVVNPSDGKSYKFPTLQQADAARRLAGTK